MKHGYNYKFPSVTQILGEVLRKKGLENWFLNNSPQYCREKSKAGKQAGTDTHALIEKSIRGEAMTLDTEYPEEVTNAVKSFLKFKEENPQYKLKQAEITLNVDKFGYSGKLDCEASEGDDDVIFDWKTGHQNSKGKLVIYPEMVYQTCMYVIGYELQFRKKIKRAIVTLFDKENVDYILRVVERDEVQAAFDNVCVPCIRIFNYGRKTK